MQKGFAMFVWARLGTAVALLAKPASAQRKSRPLWRCISRGSDCIAKHVFSGTVALCPHDVRCLTGGSKPRFGRGVRWL